MAGWHPSGILACTIEVADAVWWKQLLSRERMLSGKATLSVMQISALPGGLRLVSGSAILLPLLADVLAFRESVYRVSFYPISRQRN